MKHYVRIDYGHGLVRYFSREQARALKVRTRSSLRELTREWAESLPFRMQECNAGQFGSQPLPPMFSKEDGCDSI